MTNPSVGVDGSSEDDDEDPPEHEGVLARRKWLTLFCLASGGIGSIVLGVPAAGFLLEPLLRRSPDAWRSVGPLEGFSVGETVKVEITDPDPLPWAGLASETAVWVRRNSEEEVVAFGAYCTHVGCPVDWHERACLFMCPCHGGVFYQDGTVAAGPPPRPLPRHDVRIRRGQLQVLTAPVQRALGRRPPGKEG